MKTVIVRVFEPAPDAGPVELHGLVEDVRTGLTNPFRGGDELLAAIARVLVASSETPAVRPDGAAAS